MADLEVRQLRYFVAVAEELHFGRAAARLGMAQPPLSRAIRELERHLGVALLHRTTRQVTLTAAGEVFLREARYGLEAVSAAAQRARQAGAPVPKLRLALKADYDAGLLPRILAEYQHEEGALPVELILGGRGEQLTAIRDGRADLAMLPAPFDDRDLDTEPLITEPRVIALARTDPLTERVSLRMADLADRKLPDGTPADRYGQLAGPANSPRLDLTQIFNLVELGEIVMILPTSVAERHSRPNLTYRAVIDLPPSSLYLAWPQRSSSPAVAAFVRTATAIATALNATPEAVSGW